MRAVVVVAMRRRIVALADAALAAIREATRGTRKAHQEAAEMPCQVEVIRRRAERRRRNGP
jgi:hypothetical protein